MAVEQDQSSWVPGPPPPRPHARETAIDTALRKFDGAEEPASAASSKPWAARHRPRLALAMSVLLLLIVFIPATVGLRQWAPRRGNPSPPVQSNSVAPPATTPAGNASLARAPKSSSAPAPPAPAKVAEQAPPSSDNRAGAEAPTRPEPSAPAPAAGAGAASVVAAAPPAPPPPPSAPPPPPPPPAPAPQAARTAEATADEVVVTGTVIRSPSLQRRAPFEMKAEGPRTGSRQAYAALLSRLQDAVRTGNRASIVAMLHLPLRVNAAGGARLYQDARSVEDDFDRIFTPRVTRAILKQKASKLLVRGSSATIAGGVVSLTASCIDADCSHVGPASIGAIEP